jgi:DNA-binding LytR/AlgR family response regulator
MTECFGQLKFMKHKKKSRKKKHKNPWWIVFPGYIRYYEKNVIKRPSTIAWVEADDHSVHIHFKNGSCMTQAVCLKFMEERLTLAVFLRISKFYIVNMRMVESYRKYQRGYMLILKNPSGKEADDKEIQVSEYWKDDFDEKIKNFPAITRL